MAKARQGQEVALAVEPADDLASLEPGADGSLIEGLYRAHWSDLARYIAARFGAGPPEPEEVAQATFARLAAAPDLGQLGNPRGYLFTIACNIVIDHRRRASHRQSLHHDLSEHFGDELSDFSPENVLLAKERFAVFEKAVQAMPKVRRRIFLLVRAEGQSTRAVAQRFGMSEGAVHKHVSRALQDCAAAFEKADKHPRGWTGDWTRDRK